MKFFSFASCKCGLDSGVLGCLEVPCIGWRRRRNWNIPCPHQVVDAWTWRLEWGGFGAGKVWMHIICIPSVNSLCCSWASVLVLINRRVGVGVLPISCSPDFATTSNCSGKVLEKKKIRQIYCFPQAHSFWTRGMSSKQCNSLQMLFAFHFIIACHAMFFESLLIYYLFHFFHFPFFCMLFLLFLPFLQSSVPVCRHNGDDRTGSSRLVSHSCLSYFSALLSGKTSLGRGRKKKKRKMQSSRENHTFWVNWSHKFHIIFKAGKSV